MIEVGHRLIREQFEYNASISSSSILVALVALASLFAYGLYLERNGKDGES